MAASLQIALYSSMKRYIHESTALLHLLSTQNPARVHISRDNDDNVYITYVPRKKQGAGQHTLVYRWGTRRSVKPAAAAGQHVGLLWGDRDFRATCKCAFERDAAGIEWLHC